MVLRRSALHAALLSLLSGLLGACETKWSYVDVDGDGQTVAEGDCWDFEEGPEGSGLKGKDIFFGASEAWYDGVDQDCGGEDDYDADGDGYVPTEEMVGKTTLGVDSSGQHLGGGDCIDLPEGNDGFIVPANTKDVAEDGSAYVDRSSAEIFPTAADTWYDGIDQDCAGNSDFDQDGDGFDALAHLQPEGGQGDDCIDGSWRDAVNVAGDAAAEVNPSATEVWYDGTDQDCDSNDCDQDGDSYGVDGLGLGVCVATAQDCNDNDGTAFPDLTVEEEFYNGIDDNCSLSDTEGNPDEDGDADRDGYWAVDYFDRVSATPDASVTLPAEYLDCWDDEAAPPAGFNIVPAGSFAVLAALEVNPDALDQPYDAIDQDCAGVDVNTDGVEDDFDWDGDGHPSEYYVDGSGSFGTDCIDCPDDCASATGELADLCDASCALEDANPGDVSALGVNPDVLETPYNGTDENCDDLNDYDADGDLFVPNAYAAYVTGGYAADDCADLDPKINPGASDDFYTGIDENCDNLDDYDADQDAYVRTIDVGETTDYGDDGGGVGGGGLPGDDCDDHVATMNPGRTDTFNDGVDSDCSGNDDYDDDADGYVATADSGKKTNFGADDAGLAAGSLPSNDCDETNPAISPGDAEICDAANTDEDCDGLADNNDSSATTSTKTTYYYDADGDYYIASAYAVGTAYCDAPSALWITSAVKITGTDCDDTSSAISPGDTEICDASNTDEDCDGLADNNDTSATAATKTTYYYDADGDYYISSTYSAGTAYCDKPSTTAPIQWLGVAAVLTGTDCDDSSSTAAATFPGAASLESATSCMKDSDGDNYGDKSPSATGVTAGTDCDDSRSTVSPVDAETCSTTYDDDCDGDTNDAGVSDGTNYYVDADGDLYGAGTATKYCSAPSASWSLYSTDCLDSGTNAANTFPGAAQLESASSCRQDADGDGYGDTAPASGVTAGTDCDDDIGTYPAYTFPGAASIDSASSCMKDLDGDNYGDKTPSVSGVTAGTDCDDTKDTVSPADAEVCATTDDDDCDGDTNDAGVADGTNYYVDADGDAYGKGTATKYCTMPSGYSAVSTDCVDSGTSAIYIFPGSAEKESTSSCRQDVDGDGYGSTAPTSGATAGTDCDDTKSGVNTAASEVCSTAYDDDCDSDINDAGVADGTNYYADADADGYGAGSATKYCTMPSGFSAVSTDCVDSGTYAVYIFPGAAELESASSCRQDKDGDGYGDTSPTSGATAGADCDDDIGTYAAYTFPGAASTDSSSSCMKDLDGDNYGDKTPSVAGVTAGTDCDDALSGVKPLATETCSTAYDDDCDGDTNDAGATGGTSYYVDADGDAYGKGSATLYCSKPSGYSAVSTDCVDTGTNAVYIFPGSAETDSASSCMQDVDGDGYGSTAPTSGGTAGTDCDDTLSAVKPGATETCATAYDDDCDSDTNDAGATGGTSYYVDADGDTFGKGTATLYCSMPSGYSALSTDCVDTGTNAVYIFPGAAQIESSSACMQDVDNDGYGSVSPTSGATAGSDCNDASSGVTVGDSYALDADADDYYASPTTACSSPGAGYALTSSYTALDCNDASYSARTGTAGGTDADTDGVDDDCNGYIDEDSIAGGSILVNELMMDPQGAGVQWIELVNTEAFDIHLDGWEMKLTYYNGSSASTPGQIWISPDAGIVVPAGGTALLCEASSAWATAAVCDYYLAEDEGLNPFDISGVDQDAFDLGWVLSTSLSGGEYNTISVRLNGTAVDVVTVNPGATPAWAIPSGKSLEFGTTALGASAPQTSNNSAAYWCDASGAHSYTDTASQDGTPNATNDCAL